MTQIGLFGGTFDPVHNAHLALAEAARQALQLDEVRWVPAGQPWQKTRAVSAAQHREAMLQLALAGHPGHVIDRIEIERSGPSFTLDTVRSLQAAMPQAQWTLLIGQDQYAGLHTWQGWQELLARVTLAVAGRPGPNREVDARVAAVGRKVVPLPPMDVSSTDIRQRAAAGLPISHLVPPGVAGYIDRHSLYL